MLFTQKISDLFEDVDSEDDELSQSAPLGKLSYKICGLRMEKEIYKGETIVGRNRSAGALVVIEDPSVSVAHARITATGGRFFIADLGSTNRTILNNVLLADKFRQYNLPNNSEIRFGAVIANFTAYNVKDTPPDEPTSQPSGNLATSLYFFPEPRKDSSNATVLHSKSPPDTLYEELVASMKKSDASLLSGQINSDVKVPSLQKEDENFEIEKVTELEGDTSKLKTPNKGKSKIEQFAFEFFSTKKRNPSKRRRPLSCVRRKVLSEPKTLKKPPARSCAKKFRGSNFMESDTEDFEFVSKCDGTKLPSNQCSPEILGEKTYIAHDSDDENIPLIQYVAAGTVRKSIDSKYSKTPSRRHCIATPEGSQKSRKLEPASCATKIKPSVIRRSKNKSYSAHVRIFFLSGFTSEQLESMEKKVERVGAVVTDDVEKATHVIGCMVRCTVNFVCAVGLRLPIVSVKWIDECLLKNRPEAWREYVLSDEYGAKQTNCYLEKIYSKKEDRRLLQNCVVYVASDVQPSKKELETIVRCAGGEVVRSYPKPSDKKRRLVICSAKNSNRTVLKVAEDLGIPSVFDSLLIRYVISGCLPESLLSQA
ncbi:hypothetical protein AB6A40_003761 [Gnathostoma spinigerum]|uniref:Mediator of DNA damage checkpoint protein 1 n=1 Tax=Gnathostoma spinigerum TaxID=75299 RepID=A0ABD6ECQ4_9BILA